ncbi:FlgO family outer membrane protein [Glaciecola sp. SC05]|uniref:FlgO family outer membrane protein n=1 Tax=Glaciecola sp. SC05 TaxID=1987355 RepID=UPI003526F5F6
MPMFRVLLVAFAAIALTGCAAGKMLMAGYTPPQTIADLLNEQNRAAGVLPPELAMNGQQDNKIGIDDYKDETPEYLDVTTGSAESYAQSGYHQVESFRPRFTYKSIQDYAAQLSMDLIRTRHGLSPNARVGISSFVKLDASLQNTTILGNQLAEFLISEMQQQGMPVVDHKLMPALQVTSNGDIAFSRDVLELSNQNIMDHVLSGTMIEKANGIFVNARIISVNTNRVVASATVLIPDFVVQSTTMGYVLR